MNLHLAGLASAVALAAHAVLLIDQAGWHLSNLQIVLAHIILAP